MRVLITGATGFVGSYLLEHYSRYDEIHATRRHRSDRMNVSHIEAKGEVEWHTMDLTDAHSVSKVIKFVKPDIIHHLAAQSFVPASWDYPAETFKINVLGTINLFEAVREYSPEAVIHIASSSEVYGIPDRLPITEGLIPNPVSPYGVSKLAMDRLGYQYHKSYGLRVVITRAFNHTGPRRGEQFVCSSFAKQVAQIEKAGGGNIAVGNLTATRDFTDVRDICRAYVLAVRKCDYGTPYNICSEQEISIGDVLKKLIKHSKVEIGVVQDPKRLRPSDLHTLQGDCRRFRKRTNWKREYDLDVTLRQLLEYWRARV